MGFGPEHAQFAAVRQAKSVAPHGVNGGQRDWT